MKHLTGNILAVDDDEDVLTALRLLLQRQGMSVITETNPDQIPARLDKNRFDVILLDMNFTQDTTTGREGFFWLDRILKLNPAAVVVLITAYGDVEMAVKAIKAGAVDFIEKPWKNDKLAATVHSALQLSSSRARLQLMQSRQEMIAADQGKASGKLLGVSESMQQVFMLIDKVAKTDANVLIQGENGTGKELVARAIHDKSNRFSDVLICVDVGSLTESLFESEMFGYVKGAFTDAKRERIGRLEASSGGTLFLDEVSNLQITQQAKMLRVIEERQVTRVGANYPIDLDFRLICASNIPLERISIEGKFRQDLLYRINTVEINLPPLRERIEDIEILSRHFFEINCRKYNKAEMELPQSTIESLQTHEWRGNVRELQHAMERAVILSESSILNPSDFFLSSHQGSFIDNSDSLNLSELERNTIIKAMKKHEGNLQRVAKELGLSRPALYRRIDKYDL